MGKPTHYVTMTEEESDELEKIAASLTFDVEAVRVVEWLAKVMKRNIQELQITSRSRQLQDSQLRAAESFDTSRKKGQLIH